MLIAEELLLWLSADLTSVESEVQSQIAKELNKTLISEKSQTLWLKSTVSDTDKSVKERFRKRKAPAQKENDIYTLKNEMKRIKLHWDRI